MKLNIGSAEYVEKGYINIDNGFDYSGNGGFKFMKQQADEYMKEAGFTAKFLEMDGNELAFEDDTFTEIYSNQCVGEYVTNYKEIARVLKKGGEIRFGVWQDKVANVIIGLNEAGILVYDVDLLNGSIGDDTCTYMLKGKKAYQALGSQII